MILVGDIGGTNTTLAAVEYTADRFEVKARERFATSELSGLEDALERFRQRHADLCSRNELACFSVAGPVRNNVCRMTNVHFTIRGDEIRRQTGVPTHIINDFTAICYALPLLDTHEHIDTVTIAHPDGSRPTSHGPVRAVVGAGTGLGTGYLIEDQGHYAAHPSEGGHSDFPATDELSMEFARFLRARFDVPPGVEQYVSGQGIANGFSFFLHTGRLDRDAEIERIGALPDTEKPGAIAGAASSHDGLAEVMRLFVRLYAQYARNTAIFFLPTGGLYLAGGIAAKNESWFTGDDLFMRTFETNYNDRITPLLHETPVVLIKDYAVSLYGAAHAAVSLAHG
ncbi:MAG: glucokinase [Spirochaetota bacterium]